MAGTLSSLKYDNCAYNNAIQQSTQPLQYQMETFGILSNSKNYGTTAGIYPAYTTSTYKCNNSDKVDVEGKLWGLERINTKCKEKQFQSNDNLCVKNNLTESRYSESSSRLTNPIYNYRGMTINRFINLGVYPKSNCRNISENTRLNEKDNYQSTQ